MKATDYDCSAPVFDVADLRTNEVVRKCLQLYISLRILCSVSLCKQESYSTISYSVTKVQQKDYVGLLITSFEPIQF